MTKLTADDVRSRLGLLRRELPDLLTRNWSGTDECRFAVYASGDEYLGCISITDVAQVTMQTSGFALSRAQRASLERFCAAFNALRS